MQVDTKEKLGIMRLFAENKMGIMCFCGIIGRRYSQIMGRDKGVQT